MMETETKTNLYDYYLEKLGSRKNRKIGNNTYLELLENSIGIRLHKTYVVQFLPSGKIELNSGGWKTVTTKDRINKFLPDGFRLTQTKGIWYLNNFVFKDGITINPDYSVTGEGNDISDKNLRKQSLDYSKEYMVALLNGKVPKPSNGDCWYCLMKTESGETLGEKTGSKDHILEHMRENYFVPSLVVNALNTCGSSIAMKQAVAGIWENISTEENYFLKADFVQKQIQTCIKKYVNRQLGLVG